ncbi:hypothetical protein GDO81_018456 [Engystomops pustulosus]|uniref:Uncharacterized protein n=1 Tax=Engystomops pustulosus TaxID=76066 RepID=A0AAV6ZXM4_ENGPU|nr:hypothetical protein GDO81_018456 [Engystomops pustulosus]
MLARPSYTRLTTPAYHMSALTLGLLQINPGLLPCTFYLPVGKIAVLPHNTSYILTPPTEESLSRRVLAAGMDGRQQELSL